MYFWNCIQVKYNPKSAKLALLVKYPSINRKCAIQSYVHLKNASMLLDAYKGYFTVKTLEKKSKSMDILNRVCIQLWGKSFFFSFRSGNFSSFGKKKEIKTRYILL